MKKLAFAAFAAAATMIAVPASAQTVGGTVTLTGSVAPKCLVLSEGRRIPPQTSNMVGIRR